MRALRSIRGGLGHAGPLLIDGIAALVVFGLMAWSVLSARHPVAGHHPATLLVLILAVVTVAPIVTHRRFPLASLAVCLIAAAVLIGGAGRFGPYPIQVFVPAVLVLTFDIALHSRSRVALAALAGAAAAVAVAFTVRPGGLVFLPPVVEAELGIVVAWLAGRNLRYRRARWAELRARAERLEHEREEQARRAVTEERLRIARELHDVIAHSLSVIAVQSAVGHHVMDSQPGQARQALAAIEATSRSALTEMRRLLGVLRQEGQTRGSLAPAPGLADLDTLIAQVQDAGLRVGVHVEGQRGTVPPGVDLSAYRIIQEALTNVLKHAPCPAADVAICYRPDSLTVQITDQARPGPGGLPAHARPAGTGSGHGIIGMRERVAVFGGQFTAGPGPDGGFRVRAQFPIAEVTR
jgi:signal transduction histidine kinase